MVVGEGRRVFGRLPSITYPECVKSFGAKVGAMIECADGLAPPAANPPVAFAHTAEAAQARWG